MCSEHTACLRPMREADLTLVRSWRNHETVRRYMYTQHEISEAEHRAWFAAASKDQARHLLIMERTGVALGFIHFTQHAPGGIADWGFYTAPETPKGTGRILGRLAMEYAFVQMQLHKLCGQALGYNQRSISFHLRIGFTQEGILRDQHFDGRDYHDIYCFGLLAEQWKTMAREVH